jgi:hypothetical protein
MNDRNLIIKNCPFHGCDQTALMTQDGYAYVISLICGVQGSKYSLKTLGKDLAAETAIVDWNARERV